MTSRITYLTHTLAACVIIAVLSTISSHASTVIVPSDEEMIIGARAIVRGRVLFSTSDFDERRQSIFTYTTLEVYQVLKGSISSKQIVIKEPGGILRGRGSYIVGIPRFNQSEEVLLYLDTWPDGSLRVYQWYLGKYNVIRNPITGRPVLRRETPDEQVTVVGRSRGGESTDQADLDSYLAQLSDRISELARLSSAHEERHFRNTTMRSLPTEIPSFSYLAMKQRFTLLDPFLPQRWFEPDTGKPVVFRINPDGIPSTRMREDILASFDSWSGVQNSSIRLVNGGTTTTCGLASIDGENTISFNNCDDYSTFSIPANQSCSGVLAAAGISNFDISQRTTINGLTFYRAMEGNISFNPYAKCYFNESCNVREIATHEMGHVLGLGHSRDSNSSMYAFAHFDGRCGSLRSDDEAAIRFIYPANSVTPVPVVITSTLPSAEIGQAYEYVFSANGGAPGYRWQMLRGSLPTGMAFTIDGVLRGTPIQTGAFTFTVEVIDLNGLRGQQQVSLIVRERNTDQPPSQAPPGLMFYPLASPVRWLDTRSADGACVSPRAPIGAASPLKLNARIICGSNSIPAAAQVLVGQATVTNLGAGNGYYVISSGGAARPTVGAINYTGGQTVTTTFTVPVDPQGGFEVFSSTQVHMVIDIIGYYGVQSPGGLYFHPMPNSYRFLDTRSGAAACLSGPTAIGIGGSRVERATINCYGMTIPLSARAIIGNVSATNLSYNNGYLSFASASASRPTSFNLSLAPAESASNHLVAPLGSGGTLSMYSSVRAHLTIDVTGYFSAEQVDANGRGYLFYPLSGGMRLFESRGGEYGCFELRRPLYAMQPETVTGRISCNGLSIASDAEAIVGTLTLINQNSSSGSITLYPYNQSVPNTVLSVYSTPDIAPNSFTVRLGSGGLFMVNASSSVNIFIDVFGYFAP